MSSVLQTELAGCADLGLAAPEAHGDNPGRHEGQVQQEEGTEEGAVHADREKEEVQALVSARRLRDFKFGGH